ncbi:MAG: prepilin peptidase [Nitriliruptorales bacterium]|nr:prepilin peptidase [Nitriliruptorales bacterium]
MDAILIAGCLVAGLLAGALANPVIHRAPGGPSVTWPPPRRQDPGRASRADLLIAVVTGIAFALVGARVGWSWALPAFLLFTWTLLVIAVIDVNTRKIPNRLTYPLTPALAGLLVAAALLGGEPWLSLRAVLGGLAAFAMLLLLAMINPRGMGMGDVKLAGFIGLGLGYLGWAHVVLGVFAGFLLASLVLTVAMLAGRRSRKDMVPFGPYLSAGALLALLAGEPLIDGYVRLAGL